MGVFGGGRWGAGAPPRAACGRAAPAEQGPFWGGPCEGSRMGGQPLPEKDAQRKATGLREAWDRAGAEPAET